MVKPDRVHGSESRKTFAALKYGVRKDLGGNTQGSVVRQSLGVRGGR